MFKQTFFLVRPRKRERPTRYWTADIRAFLAFNSIAPAAPMIGLCVALRESGVVLAGKDKSSAACVREAADSILDIPAWPVWRKITQDWKSFSHSKWCAKLQGEKNSFCLEKQLKYLSTSPGTSVSIQNSQCFNTGGPSSHCEELLFFLCERSACEMRHGDIVIPPSSTVT